MFFVVFFCLFVVVCGGCVHIMSAGLIERPAWGALLSHVEEMKKTNMREMFEKDGDRFDKFSFEFCDNVFLDFSKNIINDETVKLLLQVFGGGEGKGERGKGKKRGGGGGRGVVDGGEFFII